VFSFKKFNKEGFVVFVLSKLFLMDVQALVSSLKVQLLVFSVTQFKIDQNQNQNRSIDKVQSLGNERR